MEKTLESGENPRGGLASRASRGTAARPGAGQVVSDRHGRRMPLERFEGAGPFPEGAATDSRSVARGSALLVAADPGLTVVSAGGVATPGGQSECSASAGRCLDLAVMLSKLKAPYLGAAAVRSG